MSAVRRAVIDVGTNSVKLLVAEVAGGLVNPPLEASEQNPLGRGFYQAHCPPPQALPPTAQAVANFARRAADFSPAITRVVGTSAARDAVNQAELIEAVGRASGLPLE